MGTENLRAIRCVFAENGPLEIGPKASFIGTGRAGKGDFRGIFGHHPFIFEGGPPLFSESTCPELWAQKIPERSEVYSWRMGLWKVALNPISIIPAGLLKVTSGALLTSNRAFSNREPIPF